MKYVIQYPRHELKDFVSHFWVTTNGVYKGDIHNTHYSTACSLANLIFGFKEGETSLYPAFAQLQGHTEMPEEIQIPDSGYVKIFGISIYSYAIPQLFRTSASELCNRSVPVSAFWSNFKNVLTEMIEASLVTDTCIDILSNYIRSQLVSKQYHDEIIIKATKEIIQRNGNISLERLSHDLSLSQKQFTRRFKNQTGFNPKVYSRIVRFESVLYNVMNYSSLSEAAYMHGYYDQAHFIQDFKAFSGHSPNKFFTNSHS